MLQLMRKPWMVFPSRLAWLMHRADLEAMAIIETPMDLGEDITHTGGEFTTHTLINWPFMKKSFMR